MNRTQQPLIQNEFDFQLMDYQRHEFENGCVLLNFPYEILPVAKIEFVFPAGRKYQPYPLVAGYTGKMLLEGTTSKNQYEITEGFEVLGATVNTDIYEDYAAITAYCTNNNINQVLKMLQHILLDSVFPEEQLEILAKNDKQDYLVKLHKVSFLARRQLYRSMFTESHPYGRFAEESDYDKVKSQDLISFFKTHYDFSRCQVVWTGIIEQDHFDTFSELFGKIKNFSNEIVEPDMTIHEPLPGRVNCEVKDARQSAIYIGRFVPGLDDPDFYNLNFLNTLLGGFFGSRLMKNIREDKGYTYGIGSLIMNYKHGSVMMIGTQVGAEYTEETIREIKNEIFRLQNEDISMDELKLVKNYLTGNMMQILDGPFAQSKFHTSALLHEINAQKLLEKFSQSIRQITSETIKQLANKYLQTDQLFYSVSGKIKEN